MNLAAGPAPDSPGPTGGVRTAAIGAVAVAAALGSQELAAGITRWLPSLMAGTAAWFIDIAPGWLVEWAIGTLGNWTRPSLVIGIVTVLVATGMLVARLRIGLRASAFVLVGLAGAAATAASGEAWFPSLANATLAVAVGLGADRWLRRPAVDGTSTVDGTSRRVLITSVAAIGALAIAAALGGRRLIEQSVRRLARRDDVVLPAPTATVAPVTPVHQFSVEGLEPVVTPNDRFFTVDINAFNPPEIDLTDWTLSIDGMVDTPLTLNFADIVAMDLVEQYATLACVSNKVGGRLVGNAVWLGVPMIHLLEMAGARPSAEQVAAFGADGFSTGFPLAAVYDRECMLAIGMNGEPLPYAHGFPARLIVPGYYGFMSAAKWVERIELTTWEDHDSYWVRIGWAKDAPVETQSRIDSPREGTSFAAGPRMIAGVAWAPFLGISAVEISIDDGPWQTAELSEPLGDASWRQWQLPWDATAGEHTITVRATDGTGITQTAAERPPIPNGATGHHTVRVTVQ